MGFSQQLPDSVRKSGVRLGYDLSNLAFNALIDGYSEQEATFDLGITRRVFFAAEAGIGKFSVNNEDLQYEYNSNGYFFRAGLDYDFYNIRSDIVFLGFRYGYSSIQHEAPAFTVNGGYWSDYSGSFSEEGTKGSYIGLCGGIKVELVKSLFMGFTIYGHFLLTDFENDDFPPYYVYGYGKANKNTSVSFNYAIYYTIPFRKIY